MLHPEVHPLGSVIVMRHLILSHLLHLTLHDVLDILISLLLVGVWLVLILSLDLVSALDSVELAHWRLVDAILWWLLSIASALGELNDLILILNALSVPQRLRRRILILLLDYLHARAVMACTCRDTRWLRLDIFVLAVDRQRLLVTSETLARLFHPLVVIVVEFLHLCEGHAADIISQVWDRAFIVFLDHCLYWNFLILFWQKTLVVRGVVTLFSEEWIRYYLVWWN